MAAIKEETEAQRNTRENREASLAFRSRKSASYSSRLWDFKNSDLPPDPFKNVPQIPQEVVASTSKTALAEQAAAFFGKLGKVAP